MINIIQTYNVTGKSSFIFMLWFFNLLSKYYFGLHEQMLLRMAISIDVLFNCYFETGYISDYMARSDIYSDVLSSHAGVSWISCFLCYLLCVVPCVTIKVDPQNQCIWITFWVDRLNNICKSAKKYPTTMVLSLLPRS